MKRSYTILSGDTALLLLLWIGFVVAATLFPFNFTTHSAGPVKLLRYSLGRFEDVPDVVCNLILFLPLGVALRREAYRQAWTRNATLALAGAFGLFLSLVVEYLQAFLPTRDSSLLDVLTNTFGALVGVAAYGLWNTAAMPRIGKLRARLSPAALPLMIAGFAVLALLVSGGLQARTRLSNWNPDYPLMVGNEGTGNRPWRGRVMSFELTDTATNPELVREFASGRPVHVPGRRLAAFDFSGNTPYKDLTADGPTLTWTKQPRESIGHGVHLTGGTWLRSEIPPTRMIQRIERTNAFTLLVSCATDNVNQGGPARIISNSLNPYRRNFTLGQQNADLVFRLRTPSTGENGMRPQLVVPDVFAKGQMRDILVTYDGANLLATVANFGKVYGMDLNPGSSLLASYQDNADDLPIYQLGYYALLFVPPGVLLGTLAETRKRRLEIAVPWVLVFPVLLEYTLVLASGRPFEWSNVALCGALGAVMLTVVSGIVCDQRNR